VLNMDELGARIGCLKGENIIVPIKVKELYIASPENRKSVTIIEMERSLCPLLLLLLEKRL